MEDIHVLYKKLNKALALITDWLFSMDLHLSTYGIYGFSNAALSIPYALLVCGLYSSLSSCEHHRGDVWNSLKMLYKDLRNIL